MKQQCEVMSQTVIRSQFHGCYKYFYLYKDLSLKDIDIKLKIFENFSKIGAIFQKDWQTRIDNIYEVRYIPRWNK